MVFRIFRSVIASVALFGAPLVWAQAPVPAPVAPGKVDLTVWTAPDAAKLPDTPDGKLVKYGHSLLTETYAHVGPEVADASKRYAGNNFSCQSCHLQGGTQPYAMPFVGVWGSFPQYRPREDEVSTIEERVNGCMERSMNGKPLPLDSREMKGILAYFRFASQGVPTGAALVGAGSLPIKEPNRAADPKKGAEVYAAQCAACHGEKGEGVRNGVTGDAKGYQYPPLWGPDSYNTGAGMARLLTLANFARANMPYGVTHKDAVLTDDEAYDVAAYVNSQPRPAKANLERDFPDRLKKPVDAAFPPYVTGMSAEQHKFGPFDPLRKKMKELNEAAKKK